MSVVARPPRDRELLDALTRPIELDAATHEILVAENGAVAQAASRAQGDVILFLDGDVLAPRGLASAHGRRQAEQRRRLILGYTPYRVLHERTPADYGPRLRSRHYEARCRAYERDPGTVLLELWGGNLSLWREDWLSLDLGAAETQREIALRCREAGFRGVFDRSLQALRLYEPSLSEFIGDARRHGLLEAARPAAPASGPGRFAAVPSLGLRALLTFAGTAHVWRVQDAAARLLWEVEARRGATGA